MTNHYKSWSGLNKALQERLCDPLQGHITYYLTRYHKIRDAYGRASIRLDGAELVSFDWIEKVRQEQDLTAHWRETGAWTPEDPTLVAQWNRDGIWSEHDFVRAAASFLQMDIADALNSDNLLIRTFAILDRRVGKRTLIMIKADGAYLSLPAWIRQFYDLRLRDIPDGVDARKSPTLTGNEAIGH